MLIDRRNEESRAGAFLHHDTTSGMPSRKVDAVVVGASWAGIWTLYRLKELGLKVLLVDACQEVGGVWWYTRYPGCRVDAEVPLYSFSKEELWQDWQWTERFPSGNEIRRYLNFVTHRLDLHKHMMFDKRVNAAQWNETTARWTIFDQHNNLVAESQFFIPCVGYTTISYTPKIPGLKECSYAYHTSKWPEHMNYKGKRVAIIGTAASGVQIIEHMAPHVSHLTVFQRTPNMATPMGQQAFDKQAFACERSLFPEKYAQRVSRHGVNLTQPPITTMEASQKDRKMFYESLWKKGGMAFWFGNYPDMLSDQSANDEAYAFWQQKTAQRINDPVKRALLAPKNPPHPFGSKRPSLETTYFEVFNQPNVDLVDVNTNPVVRVSQAGMHLADNQVVKVDLIILATGFDFITGSMLAMGIQGEHNTPLSDRWVVKSPSENGCHKFAMQNGNDDAKPTKSPSGVNTYLGLASAYFPNMFFPMGPQAPSAFGLTPQMAEVQGDWIGKLIEHMRENGLTTVRATTAAEESWKQEVDDAAESTLLGRDKDATSWYMGANIPGRQRQPLCYFGGVDKYISILKSCKDQSYEGFEFK